MRQKNPEEIRRDALKVAARKYAEGCGECAERYLAVAQRAGAHAEDIELIRKQGIHGFVTQVSRRRFLHSVGGAALALGVLPSTRFLTATPAQAAAPSPPTWLVGPSLSGKARTHTVTLLNDDGSLAGSRDVIADAIVPSTDGQLLYVIAQQNDAATATTTVAALDNTASDLFSITGLSTSLGDARGTDRIQATLSAAGDRLHIFHSTLTPLPNTDRTITKQGRAVPLADGSVQQLAPVAIVVPQMRNIRTLESISLREKRPLGPALTFSTADGPQLASVASSPVSSYLISEDSTGHRVQIVADVTGVQPTVKLSKTSWQYLPTVAPTLPNGVPSMHYSQSAHAVIAFASPYTIEWLDPDTLDVTTSQFVPTGDAEHAGNPRFPVYAFWAPNKDYLFILDTANSELFSVDLTARSITGIWSSGSGEPYPTRATPTASQPLTTSPAGDRVAVVDPTTPNTLVLIDVKRAAVSNSVSLRGDILAIASNGEGSGVLCLLTDLATVVSVGWNGTVRRTSVLPNRLTQITVPQD